MPKTISRSRPAPTGDGWLDLLASAVKRAFYEAEGKGPKADEAREYLRELFSPGTLAQLREQDLISW